MRKYLVVFCTFFVCTFIANNSAKFKSEFKLDVEKQNFQKSYHYTKKIFTDTLNWIKKGGLHTATWYNPHGSRTASGLRFHKDSLTAAYNFSKMKSLLKITNTATNQSVIVKVTDRMGYKGKNHIDLSKAAFDSIGNPKSGRIRVIVEEIQ